MGGAKNLAFKGLTAASARKFLKPCQREAVLALPEPSSLPGAVLAGSRPLPSIGLAVPWVSGWVIGGELPTCQPTPNAHGGTRPPGARAAGGWGLTPSAVSITGFQLVLTQQTRCDSHLQSTEWANTGRRERRARGRDQPPERGPPSLRQEAGSTEQPGQRGPGRWDRGEALDKVQSGEDWHEALQPRAGPHAGVSDRAQGSLVHGSTHATPHAHSFLNRWHQGLGINSDDRSVRLSLFLRYR